MTDVKITYGKAISISIAPVVDLLKTEDILTQICFCHGIVITDSKSGG
ncbi:hypothetical protein EMIT07CA2_10231 [Brevibacillus sp. IT-7CA2]